MAFVWKLTSSLSLLFFIHFHSNPLSIFAAVCFLLYSPTLSLYHFSHSSLSLHPLLVQECLMWWRWSVLCNLMLYHSAFWGSCAMSLNQVTNYSSHQALCYCTSVQTVFVMKSTFYVCSCVPVIFEWIPGICIKKTNGVFCLFLQVAWFAWQRLNIELILKTQLLLWRESYSSWRRKDCGLA